MRRSIVAAAIIAVLPGVAFAHVTDVPALAPTDRHAAPGHQPAPSSGEAAVIERWLAEYDAAFNAKDLQKLGTFYHPDVTIYEGGGIDNGWAAYRDGHLGPELKGFENLQFGHSNRQVYVLGDGKTAYAISTYSLKAKMGERNIDSGGLETLVLVKGADGAWKIRHSHTSSRPRRPAQ
jgi:ketosteroid isomerase-like protein